MNKNFIGKLSPRTFQKTLSFILIMASIFPVPATVYSQEIENSPAEISTESDQGIGSDNQSTNLSESSILPDTLTDNSTQTTQDDSVVVDTSSGLPDSIDQTESQGDPNERQAFTKEEKDAVKSIDSKVQVQVLSSNPASPSAANISFTYQSIAPKVDKVTGALVEDLPITVPKGRNGLQPNLSLVYNSQNLEDGSVVGYGWTVNIPYIERINRRGTNNMYYDTYFESSLSGELASTSIFNEYRPKVEESDSIKYTFATTTTGGVWIGYDKNGTKYTFGTTTGAHMDNPNDTSKVYRWMLEEIRDTNNNFIRFEYYKDAGQIYPYRVYYTGSVATDGIFQVEFSRESRSDVISSYKPGFLVQTNYRINQIQSKVNGTWVHQYALAYSTGSNTTRSLLTSVTESAQDEAGTGSISMPAVTLEYTNDPVTFTNYSTSTMENVRGSVYVTADADGNGLLDEHILTYNSVDLKKYNIIFLNWNEGRYTLNQTSDPSAYIPEYWSWVYNGPNSYYPRETGLRYFDMNGDGFADAIRSQNSANNGSIQRIYWNNGSYATTSNLVWTLMSASTTPSLPYFTSEDSNGNATTLGLFGNLNGDGIIDFQDASSGTGDPYFGDGTQFIASSTLFSPITTIPTQGTVDTKGSQLIDLNGDGLDDWVYNSSGVLKTCFNTGLGWETSCSNGYAIASTTIDNYGNDRGIRFADINGDGLPDFIRSYNMPSYSMVGDGSAIPPQVEVANIVLLNTGLGWATSTISVPETIIQYIVAPGGLYTSSAGTYLNEMWDWSGDGLVDQAKRKNASHKPDIIKKVTYSTGGYTNISYAPTTSQFTGTTPKHANLPFSVNTVSEITNNDANSNLQTISYSYDNGDMYYNTGFDRKFGGFETITETRPDSIIKTYYYQGNASASTTGEIADDVSKIGKSYKEEISDPTTSNLFKRTFFNWDKVSASTSRDFISLTKTLEQTFDGDSTHKDKALAYIYDTNTGNLIQKLDYGEVNGSSDGTFTDTGTDFASTTISYVASTTVGMFLPSQQITVDQSSNKVKETKYYYDNLSLGSVNTGNETKREFWKTSSTYASTTKSYNSYGLVTQSTDPKGNGTNYTYDIYNLYPATSTNALNQNTAYTYDYSSGQIKQTVDSNGLVTQNLYDAMDRIVDIKQPDLVTPSSLVSKSQFTYTDNTVPTKIQQTDYLNTSTSTDKYTYFDGLGRKIQERTKFEGTNTYSIKDIVYGSNGKILKESLPYLSSNTSWTTPTTTLALFTIYNFDSLGRTKTIANAVGTTTNTYKNWHVITTDPRGKSKDYYNDAFGNLVNVVEHNNSTHATTTYSYDKNNNLTNITDGAGNVRNFTYDGLNNRLTAQDLHATADTSFGSTTYVYDIANNLTQKIDAKNQTVNYTYDNLNRLLTEDYTGQAGTETTYTYDGCENGNGRLCTASTTASRVSNIYNALGLVKEATTTIAGTTYSTGYLYDRLGNQAFIKYPDNSQVGYVYNSAGRVDNVTRKGSSDVASSSVILHIDYAPTGQISLISYPNGATTTNTYDAGHMYRLTNKLTTIPSVNNPLGGLENFSMMSRFSDESFNKSSGIFIDGRPIEIESTDDNTGEDLIIKTDKTKYSGISKSTVYFSIENTTDQPQNVDIHFYLPNSNKISNIERLESSIKDVPVYSETCTSLNASTTKSKKISSCSLVAKSIEQKLYADESRRELQTSSFDSQAINQKLSLGGRESKSVDGYVANNSSKDVLQPKEIAYYKADIGFTKDSAGKFYIDAVSDTGAYGHLDPWLNSSWLYRKRVTIAGSSGSGTNYQVLLKIGESTSSTGKDFDLASHSAIFPSGSGSGGDLRFTSSDTSTELNFWVEDVFGSASNRTAYVWVKVPADLGSNQDIYVYYGNAGASDASSGNNTFTLFDDFNDGVINGAKWTTLCSSGCNVTNGNSSTISETGGVLKQFDAPVAGSQSRIIATSTSIGTGGNAMKRRFRRTDDGTYGNINIGFATNLTIVADVGTTTPNISSANFENKTFLASTATSSTAIYNTDITQNTWYRAEARRVGANTVGGTIWSDAHSVLGNSTSTLTASISDTEYPQLRSGDGHDPETDWVLVRSYHSPEPAFSSVATEEVLDTNTYIAIQNLSYTYDANGNITQITDTSDTNTAKTVGYTYDDLNRITNASTTNVTSGQTYSQTFAYDVLGNITDRSDIGSYSYAGTGYANPHAMTSFGSGSAVYDNNGNVTQISGTGTSTLSSWYSSGGTWRYRKLITINHNQVSGTSTLTNFPVLIDTTNSDFKYTSHGGKVASTTGLEMVFTASDGLTKLDYELEKYSSSTGALTAWVRIPSLATSTDTSLYVYFGNASSTDQSNKTGVWDSSYKGVYHYSNGTTLSVADSTGNANNGTNNNGATATTGKIDGALNETNAGEYISTSFASNNTNITVSGWMNTVSQNAAWIASKVWDGSATGYEFGISGASGANVNLRWAGFQGGFRGIQTSTASVSTGNWHYIVGTYDGTQWNLYINGALSQSVTASGPPSGTGVLQMATVPWNGKVDEVRVSWTARPAGWITTEYNNQFATSTFTTFGATSGMSDSGVGTSTLTWDYRNQLTQYANNNATSTYGYDMLGQRVYTTIASTTTYYPNKLYNISGDTRTNHIFLGDLLIATIQGTSTSATPYYIHTDHLGSTNVITTASTTVAQLSDYYPYGETRLDQKSTPYTEQRKYIGQEYDSGTNLNYLNARYYNGHVGKFVSEDPVFWEVGLTEDGKKALLDPQAQNSYSYVEDNPINKKDPQGRCPWCLPFLIGGAAGGLSQYTGDVMANRAAGITGMAAYAPRSSWQEYNTAIAFGAGATAAAVYSLPAAGLVALIGSGAGDVAGGRDIDPTKAVAIGVSTIATGGFFKWGAGASPAEIYMQATGKSFNSLPSNIFRNELRYNVTSETFGGSVSAILQSRFPNNNSSAAQSAAKVAGIGNTGGGAFIGTYNFGAGIGTYNFGTGSWVSTAQSTPATIKK